MIQNMLASNAKSSNLIFFKYTVHFLQTFLALLRRGSFFGAKRIKWPFFFAEAQWSSFCHKMADKSGTKYAQNARFIGRKSVSGPLNDLSLTHIVSDLQAEARKSNPAEELRCNLEFSDKHLLITYIKKDEGFESDGESTKSNEAVKIGMYNIVICKYEISTIR